MKSRNWRPLVVVALAAALSLLVAMPAAAAPPEYEAAYVGGSTVTINAIEVPNRAPQQAQADFYQVVYPIGWQSLGLAAPQCNPCDHQGNGIDFTDFHDHILDSMPSNPGHGEFPPSRYLPARAGPLCITTDIVQPGRAATSATS